jgi:hypothetical protein
MSFRMIHEWHAIKNMKCQIGVSLGSLEVQNEAFPSVPPEGQTEKWKALKPPVKAANVPNGHNAVRKALGNRGGEVGDGTRKRAMKCEMCTEYDKEGRGWERQWHLRLQRCRTWPDMYKESHWCCGSQGST